MESINEPIRIAIWVLSTINSYITLPTNDQLLKRLFEVSFSFGIDFASIEKVRRKYWIKNYDNPLNWINSIFEKHKNQWKSIFPALENIFWPENAKPIAFYAIKNADDWKDDSENYIQISLFSTLNSNKFLWCLNKEAWKDCSGSKAKALIKKEIKFPAVACFLRKNYQIQNFTQNIDEIHDDILSVQISTTTEIEEELKSVDETSVWSLNKDSFIDTENDFMKNELLCMKEKIASLEKDVHRIEENNNLLSKKSNIFEDHLKYLDSEISIQKQINDKFKHEADLTIQSINEISEYIDRNKFKLNEVDSYFEKIKKDFEVIAQNFNQKTDDLIINYKEMENLIESQKNFVNDNEYLKEIISESFDEFEDEFNDKIEFCIKRLSFISSKQVNILDKKIKSLEKIISNSLDLPSALKEIHEFSFSKVYSTFKTISLDSAVQDKGFISSIRSLLHIVSTIPNFREIIGYVQTPLFSSLYESITMLRDDLAGEYINELKNEFEKINPIVIYNQFFQNNELNCQSMLNMIAGELLDLAGSNIFSLIKSQWMICKNYHQTSLPENIEFSILIPNFVNTQDYLDSLKRTEWFTGDNKLYCEVCCKPVDSKIITKEIISHEIIVLCSESKQISFGERINFYGVNYEIFGKIISKEGNYISYIKNEDGVLVDYNEKKEDANQLSQAFEYMAFYQKII